MQRFTGKTVVVTGAASGIGLGIAERFSSEGANVVMADQHQDKLEAAAARLPGERTLALKVDVADAPEMERLVAAAVERFGALDVMCNNAGIATEGDAVELSLDDWNKTIATDLSGVFHGCRAALPELLKTRGCIVNTASVSGLGADWRMTAYNAAKGGVVNLTRAIALDFGARGVRANAVCPSLTRTGMTEDMIGDEALLAKFRERMPLGRVASPPTSPRSSPSWPATTPASSTAPTCRWTAG